MSIKSGKWMKTVIGTAFYLHMSINKYFLLSTIVTDFLNITVAYIIQFKQMNTNTINFGTNLMFYQRRFTFTTSKKKRKTPTNLIRTECIIKATKMWFYSMSKGLLSKFRKFSWKIIVLISPSFSLIFSLSLTDINDEFTNTSFLYPLQYTKTYSIACFSVFCLFTLWTFSILIWKSINSTSTWMVERKMTNFRSSW